FFFQAEDGIRDFHVTGVQTCALPISIFCLRDCSTRGTLTSTETRSRLIVAMIAEGFSSSWKTTVAPSSGGRNIPRNCPNTWLSRSEERRVGKECSSGWGGDE